MMGVTARASARATQWLIGDIRRIRGTSPASSSFRASINREQWDYAQRSVESARIVHLPAPSGPGFKIQEWGTIMHVGSIVCTTHIAVPKGARGIVQRVLGDMAMVTWYAGVPGESKELNTEPFFLEDLIDTGESVLPAGAALH